MNLLWTGQQSTLNAPRHSNNSARLTGGRPALCGCPLTSESADFGDQDPQFFHRRAARAFVIAKHLGRDCLRTARLEDAPGETCVRERRFEAGAVVISAISEEEERHPVHKDFNERVAIFVGFRPDRMADEVTDHVVALAGDGCEGRRSGQRERRRPWRDWSRDTGQIRRRGFRDDHPGHRAAASASAGSSPA